jgi:hypothetical protein
MPLATPIHPGTPDWSGENPGILLKEDPEGPWSAMALFFRIVYSPEGAGHALLLYEDPMRAASLPETHNVMVSDNEPMARYLMANFIGKLPSFGGVPGFPAVQYLALDQVAAGGDARSRYTESLRAGDLRVELVWDDLGAPVALELPVEETGTKEHEGFTVLVESRTASILVNGRALPGRPVPRVQAGLETTSAFLYFSETWIWPPAAS